MSPPDSITITVNGERRTVPADATVLSLLQSLDLNPGATAVQRNDDILSRDAFSATALSEGDVIEIVRFVGGG